VNGPSISRAQPPTVVVVGAASRDIDEADARGWRLGGTVTYSALTAAALGADVKALIGVDLEAASAHELDTLRGRGVDVQLVPLARGPVFVNQPLPDGGRAQVALSVSETLPTAALPAEWRQADAALLGPVAAELGDAWAGVFGERCTVALAWQGMLRALAPGEPVRAIPPTRTPLVDAADALFISAEDLAGDRTPLRDLLRDGQQLVATHGVHGAVHLSWGKLGVSGRSVPATPRRDPVDTVGAGDTFLGAWLAATALLPRDAEPWRALLVASVAASLSVERVSLGDHPTRAEICNELVRLRDRHRG
jgi:sugar/nucleoside kinase (ribokinase family)